MDKSENTTSRDLKDPTELDYKKAYLKLFNRVSDMIELLEEMQCEAESICISNDDSVDDDE